MFSSVSKKPPSSSGAHTAVSGDLSTSSSQPSCTSAAGRCSRVSGRDAAGRPAPLDAPMDWIPCLRRRRRRPPPVVGRRSCPEAAEVTGSAGRRVSGGRRQPDTVHRQPASRPRLARERRPENVPMRSVDIQRRGMALTWAVAQIDSPQYEIEIAQYTLHIWRRKC